MKIYVPLEILKVHRNPKYKSVQIKVNRFTWVGPTLCDKSDSKLIIDIYSYKLCLKDENNYVGNCLSFLDSSPPPWDPCINL